MSARGRGGRGSRLSAVEADVIRHLRAARTSDAAAQSHLLGTGAVARLERRLRDHYGKRYALCFSNATSALFAVANALSLKGARVICGAFGWGGTIAGPLHAGAVVSIADVDASTLTLSAEGVEHRITRSTRAVLAADVFGVPPEGRTLRRIADAHGLYYIHDGAQGFGSMRDGRPSGAFADAIVLSFTHGKSLSAGEGGAVVTDDATLYDRLVLTTQHPYRQRRDVGLFYANELGFNFRIHPLAAVWAAADFDRALARTRDRQRRAERVIEALVDSGVAEPLEYAERRIVPNYLGLTATWRRRPARGRVSAILLERGIDGRFAEFGLQPFHRWSRFRERGATPCPTADGQVKRRFQVVDY